MITERASIYQDELLSSLMEGGEMALLKGDISGLDLFERAAELDPCNPHLFYRQGLALFEYGSIKGKEKHLLMATKKFKVATHLNPGLFEAWEAWGNTLYLLGLTFEENHYFIEAEEKLKKSLSMMDQNEVPAELYWDYALVWKELANYSDEASDLQQALLAFERGVKTQQNLPPEFWNDYGLAMLSMADKINDIQLVVKAIQCFRQAVSQMLPFFEGWINLARSMNRLYAHSHDENQFAQTHDCFSAAAGLKASSVQLWQEWAFFLLEAGRKTKDVKRLKVALEKCQRGYAFEPKNPLLLAIWAEILATLGELTDRIDLIGEAQIKIEEALALSEENDPDVWHSYGKCLSSFGGYFHDLDYYHQAIEQFQEGLSLDRTRHQDWYAIAQTYAIVGKIEEDVDAFEKAVRFYKKAIHLKPIESYYPEYAFALAKLGELKHEVSLLEQAMTYFEYILQIQKSGLYIHPEWFFYYATTLDLLGDMKDEIPLYQKALETFSQVLLIEPDFPHLHFQIGLTYAHLGDATGEIDYFYRAIHHFRFDLRQSDDNDAVLLEWAATLINISQYTPDQDIAQQSLREAENKLLESARLGNEDAYYQLAGLYSLQKQHDQAIFFLQKAHKASTLPPLEELLDDDWLENLRLTSHFQEFIVLLQGKA